MNSWTGPSSFGQASFTNDSTSPPVSTPGLSGTGSRRLVLKRALTAQFRCGGVKSHRSTRRQATCGRCSCYLDTPRWIARSGISVLNWKMRLRLQRPLKSITLGRLCARPKPVGQDAAFVARITDILDNRILIAKSNTLLHNLTFGSLFLQRMPRRQENGANSR